MIRLVYSTGLRAGQELDFTDPVITLGRADSNQVVLDDPWVTERHCILTRAANNTYVIEGGLTGGAIFINDQPLARAATFTAVRITPGDQIRLGSTVFRVDEAPEPDSRSRVARGTPAGPADTLFDDSPFDLRTTWVAAHRAPGPALAPLPAMPVAQGSSAGLAPTWVASNPAGPSAANPDAPPRSGRRRFVASAILIGAAVGFAGAFLAHLVLG